MALPRRAGWRRPGVRQRRFSPPDHPPPDTNPTAPATTHRNTSTRDTGDDTDTQPTTPHRPRDSTTAETGTGRVAFDHCRRGKNRAGLPHLPARRRNLAGTPALHVVTPMRREQRVTLRVRRVTDQAHRYSGQTAPVRRTGQNSDITRAAASSPFGRDCSTPRYPTPASSPPAPLFCRVRARSRSGVTSATAGPRGC